MERGQEVGTGVEAQRNLNQTEPKDGAPKGRAVRRNNSGGQEEGPGPQLGIVTKQKPKANRREKGGLGFGGANLKKKKSRRRHYSGPKQLGVNQGSRGGGKKKRNEIPAAPEEDDNMSKRRDRTGGLENNGVKRKGIIQGRSRLPLVRICF